MSRRGLWATSFLAFWVVALGPGTALAQSAIAGQVIDSTGGVLPSVTVEARSAVLIERARTVDTNGQGRYTIVDLRPGSYTVTFTLSGFSVLVRDDIRLPSDFTAKVNADMIVGGLEESVTVAGDAPVVDIQQTGRVETMSRDMLDTLPTGRNIPALGGLVPGIKLSNPDLGGSSGMENASMFGRGTSAMNTTIEVDGMIVNGLQANGQVQSYFNDFMNQEVSFQTSGIEAETSRGGIRINMIPAEGGNTFGGSAFIGGTHRNWQGNNITGLMEEFGIEGQPGIDGIYDINVAQGGPILQDTLWFFGSFRRWVANQEVTDSFYRTGTTIGNTAPGGEIDPTRRGVDDNSLTSGLLRLTYQINDNNKFSVYLDRIRKRRFHDHAAGDVVEDVAWVWGSPNYMTGQAKWTATVTNRLLIEAGYSTNIESYNRTYQPDSAAAAVGRIQPQGGSCFRTPCDPFLGLGLAPGDLFQTDPWYALATREDLALGTRWNAAAHEAGRYPQRFNIQAAASYVTGSHNIKVGFGNTFGSFRRTRTANADLEQEYVNGRPFAVVVYNTPVAAENALSYDLGVFAQDRWTLDRFTLNLGVRVDWAETEVSGSATGAGRFVEATDFPTAPSCADQVGDELCIPSFFDVSPRLGVAYDLRGDGRTAIKFNFGKYMGPMGVDCIDGAPRNADCYNPAAFQANRRFWGDVCITAACAASPNPYGTDGDGIAQNWEIGPTSRSSFSRVTDRPDADLNRLYELAFTAGIEHEIRPGVSARFQWFRRSSHNQEFSDNRLRSFADYTPFRWVAPSGEVITSFSLNPAAAALDDTVDGNAVTRTRVYNGLDVSVSARLPGGGQLLAGWTMEKERQQNCDEIDDPNLMRFCDERSAGLGPPSQAGTVPGFDGNFLTGLADGLGTEFPVPWRHEFKLVGSYPLPGGFQVQAALQSYPGIGVPQWFLLTRGTTYSEVNGYSQDSCAPPCVFNAPINRMLVPPSLIVPLAPLPGQLASTPSGSNKFLPRWTLLDAGVTKRFDISGLLVDVKAEVINLLNADFYLSTRSPFVNTPVYDVPVSITQARLLRLASTIRW